MDRKEQMKKAIAARYPQGANLTSEGMIQFFEKVWAVAYTAGQEVEPSKAESAGLGDLFGGLSDLYKDVMRKSKL